MSGSNFGDGTNWSSERGNSRNTGLHWGGGNSGGNAGGNNTSKRNVTVLNKGQSHTTKWGTVVINSDGYATMNGIVMTNANSSLIENGPNAITRVLNSLLVGNEKNRGDNVNLGDGSGVFYPIFGHPNLADSGRYLEPNYGGKEFYARVENNIYAVKVLNEKQDLFPQLIVGEHSSNTSARRQQQNKSEDVVRAYLNEINDSIRFASDFFKEVTAKYGANSAAIAQELADSAKGKRIKNFNEAVQAYNKYGIAIHNKFSVADREAIARALESINRNVAATNLTKFSKAFGAVGYTLDFSAVVIELTKGIRTGDYSSFYLKLETMTFGLAASAVVAFTFAALVTTPFGILAFGLLLALTGALVDEALILKINNAIFN